MNGRSPSGTEVATAFPGNTGKKPESVAPLDDRSTERLNPAIAGRPDLMGERTSLTVYDGMVGMSENVFINVKNRSHTLTADVMVPEKGVEGVILAQAGRFGGWWLYVKDGKPTYTYNYLDQKRNQHCIGCMFSLDEGTDVGRDDVTPVTQEYKVPFAFTGATQKVEVKLR